MKRYDSVRIKKEMQGAPVINGAFIEKDRRDVVLICIDMKSKYTDIISSFSGSDGSCGLLIGANPSSLFLKKGKSIDDITRISFPQFKGFEIYCYYCSRYSIQLCLVKKKIYV